MCNCGHVCANCASNMEDATWDSDAEEDYDEEEAERLEDERMAECHCGAYQYSKKLGRYIHVADCIC